MRGSVARRARVRGRDPQHHGEGSPSLRLLALTGLPLRGPSRSRQKPTPAAPRPAEESRVSLMDYSPASPVRGHSGERQPRAHAQTRHAAGGKAWRRTTGATKLRARVNANLITSTVTSLSKEKQMPLTLGRSKAILQIPRI